MTMAQAVVRFMTQQRTARDGREQPFFGGVFGIFGHGNVAGIGQALQEQRASIRYYLARNEQAMVHTAAAYAKMHNRLRTLACTSSIGPGRHQHDHRRRRRDDQPRAGAAAAGRHFRRPRSRAGAAAARVEPVAGRVGERLLQAGVALLGSDQPAGADRHRAARGDARADVAGRNRRGHAGAAAGRAGRGIRLPGGAVRAPRLDDRRARVRIAIVSRKRRRPIRRSTRPIIVAGGGVLYSEATDALRRFVDATGIPVGETQAGKGSLPDPHPLCLGGIGATGTRAANALARDADLVIVIGSRLSDFTTASKTAFQREHVRFIAINVAEIDAGKHAAIPLVGDARAALEELLQLVEGYRVSAQYTRDDRRRAERLARGSRPRVRIRNPPIAPVRSQSQSKQAHVIGVLQDTLAPTDVIVCAAGSLPGDLHKLWRARDPKGYHLEYGYSCMGYEIAGGLGVKMAAPDRGVYVLVGDGSYLMMAQEIVTAVQERVAITIVLLDNHGFASIGGLSESVGSGGFGTRYRGRNPDTGELDGGVLPIDLAANAASLGATRVARGHDRRVSRRARRRGRPRRRRGHRRAGRPRVARRRLRVVVGRAGGRSVGDSRSAGRARRI